MSYSKYKIHQLIDLLNKKEVSAKDLTAEAFKRIEEKDQEIGAFLALNKEEALKKADQVDEKRRSGQELASLAGIPMALKDNISTKGLLTTAASKMLHNYIPPYNARVVDMLDSQDAILLGKVNMDEFAMGVSNEASAAAVASGQAFFALGSDTAGSIRQAASFSSLVGLKPTYGSVSRFGLIALAPSMDQIGPLTKDVRDMAIVYSAIAGYDPADSTSAKRDYPDFTQALGRGVKGMRIGLPKELIDLGLSDDVKKAWQEAAKELEDLGAHVEECSLPNFKYASAAYSIISAAEASSDLARYDGIRYGYRAENQDNLLDMFTKTREEGFGSSVKSRLLLGAFVLNEDNYQNYYIRALKARRLVKEDFDQVFNSFDLLLTPTTPDLVIPANLAGLPALSLAWGQSAGMPIGLQLMGPAFAEEKIFAAAYELEINKGGNAE